MYLWNQRRYMTMRDMGMMTSYEYLPKVLATEPAVLQHATLMTSYSCSASSCTPNGRYEKMV